MKDARASDREPLHREGEPSGRGSAPSNTLEMGEPHAASRERRLADDAANHVRFIILCDARTGSNMLVQALNSNPSIICYAELFRANWDFTRGVASRTHLGSEDRTLRDQDSEAFLRERIFRRHGEEIGAVGFKIFYEHFAGFEGLEKLLTADTELRVLHLQRRNLLRALVSFKIALETGSWSSGRRKKSTFTLANVLAASRHPLKGAAWMRRRRRLPWQTARIRVTISEEELRRFIRDREATAARFDSAFGKHPRLKISYEDIVSDREEALNQVQSFLGVEPRPLTVSLERQNPEPLRKLIENYDEVFGAFRNTPCAAFFEELPGRWEGASRGLE